MTLALSIGGGGTLNMLMVLLTAIQLSFLYGTLSCTGLASVYCEWLMLCESTLWLSQSWLLGVKSGAVSLSRGSSQPLIPKWSFVFYINAGEGRHI